MPLMTIQEHFDATQRKARRRYWQGVRDAQRDEVRPWAGRFAADYRLGVFHVTEGIIRRLPLTAVHDGPEFREASSDPDIAPDGHRIIPYAERRR